MFITAVCVIFLVTISFGFTSDRMKNLARVFQSQLIVWCDSKPSTLRHSNENYSITQLV